MGLFYYIAVNQKAMKRIILILSVIFTILSCDKDEPVMPQMRESIPDSVRVQIYTENIGTPSGSSAGAIEYFYAGGDTLSVVYLPYIAPAIINKDSRIGTHYYIKLYSTTNQRLILKVDDVKVDSVDCLSSGVQNSVILTGNF